MKTSEDKLNEALRDVLKRKFDDYEEQPNPAALDRIRARVRPARTGRYWWFTGALVLFSVSGVLLSRYFGDGNVPSVVSDKAVVRTGNESASPRPAGNKAAKASDMGPKAPHAAQSVSRKKIWKIKASQAGPLVKSDFVEDLGNKPAPKAQKLHASNLPGATVSRYRGLPSANAGGTAASGTSPDDNDKIVPDALAYAPKESGIVSEDLDAALSRQVPETIDSATQLPALDELAGMPLKEAQIPLHPRGVVAPAYKPAKVIVTNPARMAWLFNASALHTYQILTVPSSAANDFQNFSFPSLFTARSVGYKFSGGVERKGIQLQLHFNSFRQTYSYEVANNNYLVTPDDKGQYQTIRQGDRMEENRRFSTLGIGISKQVRWGHSPVSRFFAAFGAEYSHDLNSSQSLGWVSLGLGKQFAVSRSTAFNIGPFAEFSPVKVKGIANPFYYQPYRVGISAGLRFVKP